jgi:hypothetical protein
MGWGMSRREYNRTLNEAARDEAQALIRKASEPVAPGEHIATQIARAAERLGVSYRRGEDIWRREAKRIDSWEMDKLRSLAKAKRKRR